METVAKGNEINAAHLRELLTRRGSNAGWTAFVRLCNWGGDQNPEKHCDRHLLGEAFVYVSSDEPLLITKTPEQRLEQYSKKTGSTLTDSLIEAEKRCGTTKHEIYLRPMDSRAAALGNFETRQIEELPKKCRKLAEELAALHSTRLVRHGRIDGEFPDNTPFDLPFLLMLYADKFLPQIIEKAKQVGPKQKPDYTRLLTKIYKHIHDRTKGWRDSLVADILNDLLGHEPDRPLTAESQRAWRYSHGLVDKND